jgi:hypothetical protein
VGIKRQDRRSSVVLRADTPFTTLGYKEFALNIHNYKIRVMANKN